MHVKTFQKLESNVRSYCRTFPTVFTKGRGHLLTDERGKQYVDFFSGAGALNYGHNNPHLKAALIEYLSGRRRYALVGYGHRGQTSLSGDAR